MIPDKRVPTHPGVILVHEFLEPMGISQAAFGKHLGVPSLLIDEIVQGKRGITSDTAFRFSRAFGTTPELWITLQAIYDLTLVRSTK